MLALGGIGSLLGPVETIGGYQPPLPVGEGNRLAAGTFTRPWAIPLVVGLGGLISGFLVFRFAPEAEGHGTDAAIAAVHHNPRGIRGRLTFIKLLASAATIGSGGSAGREGPTAQISAGFGSLLARRLELSPQDARIAVAVGVGSGIGAIFRAPLGGAVLGAEILYRDDLEPEALFPSLVASIVGFSIFGAVEGFEPIFGTLRTPQFDHPIQLLCYAVLGIAAGLVGRMYAHGSSADVVEHPDTATPNRGAIEVLQALSALRNRSVAVQSERAFADLQAEREVAGRDRARGKPRARMLVRHDRRSYA